MTGQGPDPFAEHMPVVARALFGDPNGQHSRPGNPRWGNKGSLTVDETRGVWFDHENGKGGGVLDLIEREKKLSGGEARDWLRSIGCSVGEPQINGTRATPSAGVQRKTIETYNYADIDGTIVLQVRRMGIVQPSGDLVLKNGKPEKTFAQRRPYPGKAELWIWGAGAGEYMRKGPGENWYRFNEQGWAKLPTKRERKTFEAAKSIPYRLPELTEAIGNGQPVFVVEGEQKVDALAKLNLRATCNAEGAGKWTTQHAVYLKNADVIVLPDNDQAGRDHAERVARSLVGIASRIRALELPGLPPKGDVVDWAKSGGTREELDALVERAPEWQRVEKPAATAPTTHAQDNNRAISAKELNAMRFDPIKYVVPGIIVEGVTLFAAKPKMGKSWMVLHAAIAVASNGYTLGEIHCPEGDVLYCALEDNLRRLQSRMTKLLGTRPWPERLNFQCEMPRLAEGGLNMIRKWIEAAECPRLIIIDTLAMVRAPRKRDESNYDADYSAVKDLRALANECGVAIVLVHHLRKQEADDTFDTVSGTLGLTGATDSILVLKRDSTGNTVLHGRGRDLLEVEKAMTFSGDTCMWTIAGEVREVRISNERRTILAAMKEIELPAKPAEIATAANLKQANVRKLLSKMVDDGTLKKGDYGKYDLAIAADPA